MPDNVSWPSCHCRAPGKHCSLFTSVNDHGSTPVLWILLEVGLVMPKGELGWRFSVSEDCNVEKRC